MFVRITKMWHRDISWVNAVGEMVLLGLLDAGLPWTFNLQKTQYFQNAIKWSIMKWGMPVHFPASFELEADVWLICAKGCGQTWCTFLASIKQAFSPLHVFFQLEEKDEAEALKMAKSKAEAPWVLMATWRRVIPTRNNCLVPTYE